MDECDGQLGDNFECRLVGDSDGREHFQLLGGRKQVGKVLAVQVPVSNELGTAVLANDL